MDLELTTPRKLLVQPGRDGTDWTVRIDDYGLFGSGASREAALDDLAETVKMMFDAGELGSTERVPDRQLRQEKRLYSWLWAARKRRPLAQIDYTTLQALLVRAA